MGASRDIQIQCIDGVNLAATLCLPSGQPDGVLVLCSALGVPRRFYGPLAGFLSSFGHAVITFDYRGTGGSLLPESQAATVGMAHWGRLDINAVLGVAMERFPGARLYALGHSCGGQLIGLAPNSERLAGAILVAAALPNWRLWAFPMNLALLALWYAAVPALCSKRASVPGRWLGFGNMDLPAGVLRQWARWARMDEFLFSASAQLDTGRYDTLRIPMLAVYATDDRYAPARAVKAMNRKYYHSPVQELVIDTRVAGQEPVGHLGYFRERLRGSLWRQVALWLKNQAQQVR